MLFWAERSSQPLEAQPSHPIRALQKYLSRFHASQPPLATGRLTATDHQQLGSVGKPAWKRHLAKNPFLPLLISRYKKKITTIVKNKSLA